MLQHFSYPLVHKLKHFSQWLESYSYINDQIVSVIIKIKRGYVTVIVVYAPEDRKKEAENLCNVLQKLVHLLRQIT